MKRLYPSPTAKKGNILANDKVYYCEQCGFGCRKSTTRIAKNGTQAGSTINITTDGESPTNIQVTQGCPFCGSLRSKIR